jgi:hypothetical protein
MLLGYKIMTTRDSFGLLTHREEMCEKIGEKYIENGTETQNAMAVDFNEQMRSQIRNFAKQANHIKHYLHYCILACFEIAKYPPGPLDPSHPTANV